MVAKTKKKHSDEIDVIRQTQKPNKIASNDFIRREVRLFGYTSDLIWHTLDLIRMRHELIRVAFDLIRPLDDPIRPLSLFGHFAKQKKTLSCLSLMFFSCHSEF